MKKETPALAESSALAVGKNEQNWNTQRGTLKKSEEKEKRWCDLCNKPGHIQDKYWKLHGKPANFSKGSNSGKAFQISIDQQQKIGTEDRVFSKSQMELLQKMFNDSISQSKTTNTTANIAQASTSHKALSAKTGANMWIVDSGATDHMTGSSNLFSTYIPCSGQQKV